MKQFLIKFNSVFNRSDFVHYAPSDRMAELYVIEVVKLVQRLNPGIKVEYGRRDSNYHIFENN